jgi:hypothetical protein
MQDPEKVNLAERIIVNYFANRFYFFSENIQIWWKFSDKKNNTSWLIKLYIAISFMHI